jgi:hypothetical protein
MMFPGGIGTFGGADREISSVPDAFSEGKTQKSLGRGEKYVGERLRAQGEKQIPQVKSSALHVPEPVHLVNFKISLFSATAPLVNFKNNVVKTRFTQGKMRGETP